MKFLMPLRKIAPKSIFGRVSRCSNIKNIGLLIVNLSADSFLLFFCCITSYENILKLNYLFLNVDPEDHRGENWSTVIRL